MRKQNCRSRAGAATVEFALVAPILIMFVFGIIEFSRGLMVRQTLINATREGAREASLPDATMSSVKTKVVDFLDSASIDIDSSSVTVTPDPEEAIDNEQITVSVSIPYSEIGWINGSFLQGISLEASTKMRSERLE